MHVKATIEGREYSFAPLKIKEMKQLSKLKEAQSQNIFDSMDLWRPYIEASMSRAGNEMPDFEDMDVETGSLVFAELIRGVMKASGVELAPVGEALPVATSGKTSMVSSSPLPGGRSTTSTSSPSTM